MSIKSSATAPTREAFGMMLGLIAVISFSLTLPLTKATVTVFGGWTVGLGRAAFAGLVAAALLACTKTPLPDRTKLGSLAAIAGGVVFGFPILTALALEHVPATRGAIVVGLLPVSTALIATLRHGERPSPGFWLAAGGGVGTVVAFAVVTGSSGGPEPADALLGLAVVAAAIGYAEGAHVSKSLGGWQTISWALVLSLPATIPMSVFAVAKHGIIEPTTGSIIGFVYVSLISMLIGFFIWYAALSIGGTARVSQVQLVQPLLSLGWAWLLLDETITVAALSAAFGVLVFVALSKQAGITNRIQAPHRPPPESKTDFTNPVLIETALIEPVLVEPVAAETVVAERQDATGGAHLSAEPRAEPNPVTTRPRPGPRP